MAACSGSTSTRCNCRTRRPSSRATARYRAGLPGAPELLPFHKAFALFRFAVIFVGIADRAKAGSAADPQAAALAPLAERFAFRALEIVDGTPHAL